MNQLDGLIERLMAISEQDRQRVTQSAAGPAKAKVDTSNFIALEIQIQNWWEGLPPAMQSRRFHVSEIAQQCRGRYRPAPALREVALALRLLGWQQRRDWTKAGRNTRFWHKPFKFD